MTKGFVYILECSDGTYYTGSTIDIDKRIDEHNSGIGANHTKKRLPVELVYFEEFQRIDDAFYREKQIQGWSRKKKEALINSNHNKLPSLSMAYRDKVSSRASDTESINSKSFYSNGKLLITGEYLVLDGATALALPTKYGQSLTVEPINEQKLYWNSLDHNGEIWFDSELSTSSLAKSFTTNNNPTLKRLFEILISAKQLNSDFLVTNKGYKITTKLDFPRNWGLGSSSTLINNIANWANVNAFELLELTFGGSGYDIACAQFNTSLIYSLDSLNNKQKITSIEFSPSFKNELFFVHLNKKQNSRDGIKHYESNKSYLAQAIADINLITANIIKSENISEFELLITKHEQIISRLIDLPTVKSSLFPDYSRSIKSLGAWGGDFILASGNDEDMNYFKQKGYQTIIPYHKMIL